MIVLLITILFIIFLLLIFKKSRFNIVYLISSILLSVVAFNFDPIKAYISNGNYTDLYRFYEVLDSTRLLGWEYISNHPDYKSLFIARIYVYLSSFFKSNGFLPAITCLIVYGVIFYIIYKFGQKTKCNKSTLILVSLFFLITINFRSVITNIRNPIVFCIFFFLMYIEFVEQKYKLLCWIGYILLCFMHQVALFLIGLRLLMLLYNKYSGKIINIVIILWSFLSQYAIQKVSALTSIPYFKALAMKTQFYSGDVNELRETNLIMIAVIKIILFICLLLYFNYSCNEEIKNKYKKIYEFSLVLICFNIGSYPNYHLFIRLPDLLTYFMLIFIILIFGNKQNNINYNEFKLKKKNFLYGLLVKSEIYFTIIIYFIYYFFSYQYGVLCY